MHCKHSIIVTAAPSIRHSRRKSTCCWVIVCSNLAGWKIEQPTPHKLCVTLPAKRKNKSPPFPSKYTTVFVLLDISLSELNNSWKSYRVASFTWVGRLLVNFIQSDDNTLLLLPYCDHRHLTNYSVTLGVRMYLISKSVLDIFTVRIKTEWQNILLGG
jgi:hypothetical protein